jgi:alpha-glucoside transport system permease protein
MATTVAPPEPLGTAAAPQQPGAPPRPRPSLSSRLVKATSHGPIYVLLIVTAVLWLLPTLGHFVASFRTTADNGARGWWTAITEPSQLTLENYRHVLSDNRIVDSLWNTVLISVPATVLVVVLGAMAAYAFAWIPFPGRDPLFLVVVAMLVVPLQVALIPIARLYGWLGIFGDLAGVIMFHVAFGLPLAVFLLRNFFAGIPGELMEAARMDGAGDTRIFLRVVMPLGFPALASLAIFQFLWTWNDLLVGLVFANPGNRPVTVAIQQQTEEFGLNLNVIAPAAMLSMVVPLIVFLAFQRYFVEGLLAGSNR